MFPLLDGIKKLPFVRFQGADKFTTAPAGSEPVAELEPVGSTGSRSDWFRRMFKMRCDCPRHWLNDIGHNYCCTTGENVVVMWVGRQWRLSLMLHVKYTRRAAKWSPPLSQAARSVTCFDAWSALILVFNSVWLLFYFIIFSQRCFTVWYKRSTTGVEQRAVDLFGFCICSLARSEAPGL